MIEFVINISSLLLIVLFVIYTRQIHFFYRGLTRLKSGSNSIVHSMTIIIPARNEEENIERCLRSLMQQDYPKQKLSIIVIDDQSSDRTGRIVSRIAAESAIPISLHRSDERSTIRSPKIRALMQGIRHSAGEIILVTDADCIAQPEWVSSINSYFEETVGIVTGLTTYDTDERISGMFRGIQFLDFISYTAVAAGAIGMNRVLVSNGSNMAFRIQAFEDAGGFDSIAHINTGDDSLLAQKIVESGAWTARFAYQAEATIATKPVRTWKEMFQQRMRWVGQTAYYPRYMMFFMICTFIMFIVLSYTLPMTLSAWNPAPWIILAGLFSVDYLMMHRFTTITDTRDVMTYFLPTALLHIPMTLVITIGGYFFSFTWKDRRLRKE